MWENPSIKAIMMHFLKRFYVMKQKTKVSQRDEHKSERNTKEKLGYSPNSNKGEDKTPEICFKY